MPVLVANLMSFACRKRKKSQIICLGREMNPGLMRGKRELRPLRHTAFVKDNTILMSFIFSRLCKAFRYLK